MALPRRLAATARCLLPAAASLLLIAGCTRNTLIVVAPQPAATAITDPLCSRVPAPRPVTNPGPILAYPVIAFPDRARQAGIRIGCAGIFYRISPAGHVIDQTVGVESPPGYDFGTTVLAAMPRFLFQPRPNDPSWHFMNATLRDNAAPAGRATPPLGTTPRTALPPANLPPATLPPAGLPPTAPALHNPFQT